jgi:hypothetical protein
VYIFSSAYSLDDLKEKYIDSKLFYNSVSIATFRFLFVFVVLGAELRPLCLLNTNIAAFKDRFL